MFFILPELVLKVRIAQDLEDDFIEVELQRPAELTYYRYVFPFHD